MPLRIAAPEPFARLGERAQERVRLHRQRHHTTRLGPRGIDASRIREQRVVEIEQQRLHARLSAGAIARTCRGSRTRSTSTSVAAMPPSAVITKTAENPAASAISPASSGAENAMGAPEV